MAGLLGHGVSARQGLHVHVALFHLGSAELLAESFPVELLGTGLMWCCEDTQSPLLRGHKLRWERYLAEENLTESQLRDDFFVICKTGGPPEYQKCLTVAGDVYQALTLLENFFAFAFRLPEFMGVPNSLTYHNSSSIDIAPWLSESDRPNSSIGEKTYPLLQLKNFVPPDYRRPTLEIHREHGNLVQLILGGYLWRCRPLLGSFQCGYRHRVTKQECEKGPDAEFVRYSEAFPPKDLQMWLGKLPDTLFWVEGADSEIMQTLQAFPLLVTARSTARHEG